MVKHANMEIALHQDDVNVRWDGKLPTLCISPLFVSSQSFLKLEGMETFAINVWPCLVVKMDIVNFLCNVFVKKDGQDFFVINVSLN